MTSLACLLLAACGLLPTPTPADPHVAVVVVNGSAIDAQWIVDTVGPDEAVAVPACSAAVNSVQATMGWRLEHDGRVILAPGDVPFVDAAVAVIRVEIAPSGQVNVTGPTAEGRIPAAPAEVTCR